MNLESLRQEVVKQETRFIVVTGGVCSSLGKGVLISALGTLLKNAGYTVSVTKWDPYLNVDPGTMSPLVHGEVFVTDDGAETDLDLGHYERILGIHLTRDCSITSGQIFQEILDGERKGEFLGRCIQMVPHVVDAIKKRVLQLALKTKPQFVLIEIGGTVGDIEGELFLEAIRELKMQLADRMLHCHLSYIPFLSWAGEFKTKPTQHSVMLLKKAGLIPDMLFLRADSRIPEKSVKTVAVMCGVAPDAIFQVLTFDPLYQLFLDLQSQGVHRKVQEKCGLKAVRESDLSSWKNLISLITSKKKSVRIVMVVKYIGADPYISVIESLKSAGYACHYDVDLHIIPAEKLENKESASGKQAWEELKMADGILVPGGFDERGIEGKIAAAHFARENRIPYLGLCLGMQVMLIEAARSLLGLSKANSTEINPTTPDPVISLLEEQTGIKEKGATMRLGAYPCDITPGTKAYAAYGEKRVMERHRHRYEFNNKYRKDLEDAGVVFSGMYKEKNLVEIAEIKDHPFMVASQFHPEFLSTPLKAHPLFKGFMQAAVTFVLQKEREG